MYDGLSGNSAVHAAGGRQKSGGRRRRNATGRGHSVL